MNEIAAAATAAAVSLGLNRAAITANRSGRAVRWARTNHAGAPVTLLEGPAALGGLAAGTAIQLWLRPRHRRAGLAALLAATGSGLVGGYDDLYGNTQAKGFRGHLRALRRGELTSGMIKIAGVGLSALAAAVITSTDRAPLGVAARLADVVIDTTLVAGTANLANLFDLRPGRAGKVIMVLSLPGLAGGSAPALGATVGALRTDLVGSSMLGDTGANGLGAAVGTALLSRTRAVRLTALVIVVGLTAISERVSFTAVIERTPWLRALDQAGRPR